MNAARTAKALLLLATKPNICTVENPVFCFSNLIYQVKVYVCKYLMSNNIHCRVYISFLELFYYYYYYY